MDHASIYSEISALTARLSDLYRQLQAALPACDNPYSKAVLKSSALWLVPPDVIKSKLRSDRACLARWTAWYILQHGDGWDHDDIAKAARCHRTNIIYALRALQARAQQSSSIQLKLISAIADP